MRKINSIIQYSLLVFVLSLLFSHRVSAAYDSSNLISDVVFTNSTTMTQQDIQNFLVSKNSGLANIKDIENCGSPSGANYSYYSRYYSCGQLVSASKIIYDSGQAYGINPQVILSTLQKEQSLITTPNPTSSQINCAMGYSSCNGYVGFFSQVDNGAWQFRTYIELMSGRNWWGYTPASYPCKNRLPAPGIPPTYSGSGNNSIFYYPGLLPNQAVSFYDYYGNLYSQFVIANAATAAMYCYTPHVYPGSASVYYSGSYNFVTSFENWFGSTQGPILFAHPDGTLIKLPSSPDIYVILNGKAQFATSLGVFKSWGYNFGSVKNATPGDAALISNTVADPGHINTPPPLKYREGTLIKGSGPTVYVVENQAGENTIRSLVDLDNFNRLGYNFNQVITVPDSELPKQTGEPYGKNITTHPNGTLIRDANSPTVYYIINGERHSMTSLSIFHSHRFNFNQVVLSVPGDNQLPVTWPVTWYGEGSLVKGSGPTVYVIDLDVSGVNQSKRSIGSYYNFIGLGYNHHEVFALQDIELPATNGSIVGQ